MPRRKTVEQAEFPYHITARTINRDWFSLPMDLVWETFENLLFLTHIIYNLKIHSFVLMNNHFHLIASTPQSNISQCMYFFMKYTSRELTKAGNRINQTYSGRYYKTILHENSYFLNAYKYDYLNPVKAGICTRPENYRYSTLHGLLGFSKLTIPIEEDLTLFSDIDGTLKWLNQMPSEEQLEAVRWALKREYFRSKKYPGSKKFILREGEII